MKLNFKIATLFIFTASQMLAEPTSIEGNYETVSDGTSVNKGEIAKKLANPLESMISLPLLVNQQPNMGVNDQGEQWISNIQPVIPIEFNAEWNIISRTIIPFVSKDTGIAGENRINAVGDIVQSTWFSPRAPTEDGWIWGVGAVILIPSDSDISTKKWGAGPTALALRQEGPWTYGGQINQLWSFAGSDIYDNQGNVVNKVNQTLLQPFLAYITPQAITIALNTESNYDWEREEWTVPVTFMVSKVGKVGNQLISYGAGASYWAESPESGPEGWGFRFRLTFIFPK